MDNQEGIKMKILFTISKSHFLCKNRNASMFACHFFEGRQL